MNGTTHHSGKTFKNVRIPYVKKTLRVGFIYGVEISPDDGSYKRFIRDSWYSDIDTDKL